MTEQEIQALGERIAEPFDATEIKWKPQQLNDKDKTKANRAMAVAYVDARVVMDRLDDVFGIGGWQDSYATLAQHTVCCTLRVKVGEEWITKTDVGSESEQPDEGDRMKAAFSDALKRTAVKLGIGRYLYRLPRVWVDYDPQKRQITKPPELPAWARPKTQQQAPTPVPVKQAKNPTYTAITKEQAEEIKKLLGENGNAWSEFSHAHSIDKITALPASLFAGAVEQLKRGDFKKPAA